MANDSIRGRQVVLRLTNKSGGDVVEGDVVIISSGTAAAFTTTTTANLTTDAVGVVLESIADNATGRVCISGYVPKIALSASASLGDTVATHTVAKQAAPAAARTTGSFGEVLGTGATPAALLWGMPDGGSAGGSVATDTIWDAAGDIVQGTGSNTAGRLAIGTAGQYMKVNDGATALEYATGGRVLISEQTPTGTGTVTWSSIPATYKDLEVECVVRTTDTTASDYTAFTITLNNDTTDANYAGVRHNAYFTNTQNSETGENRTCGLFSNASTTAGIASQCRFYIIQYAGTTFFKQVTGITSTRTETGDGEISTYFSLNWESTTAINRIDIILAAGNYDTGSTFRLYGVY